MTFKKLKILLLIYLILILLFSNISIAKDSIDKTNSSKLNFEPIEYISVKEIDGVWWFINADGTKFYVTGANGLAPSPFTNLGYSNWLTLTRSRLDQWGINTVTGDKDLDKYYIERFRFKHISSLQSPGWNHGRIPDVFDPWWISQVENATIKYATPLKNETKLLGYYTDNEMKWGPDTLDTKTLLDVYMGAGNQTAGKSRLIAFFKSRYPDIEYFNQIWNMAISDFSELKNHNKIGIEESWRIRSNIDLYVNQIIREYPYLSDVAIFEKIRNDIKDFSQLVAHNYFNITSSCLKAADPNHLNLGVRLHLLGTPPEVIEECGRFVDVISINYYRKNIGLYDPNMHFLSKKFGCVPLNNWMKNYYSKTGKPLMVGEYCFTSNDGSYPARFNVVSPSKVARTQQQRANLYKWYNKNCFNKNYIVGNMWFIYKDLIDINRGFVDVYEKPYEEITKAAAFINNQANELHQNSISNCLHNEDLNYKTLIEKTSNIKLYHGHIKDYIDIDLMLTDFKDSLFISSSDQEIVYVDDDYNELTPGFGINHFNLIQDGVDNVRNKGIVYVNNGTYVEKLFINKSISIIGENKKGTILDSYFEDDIFVALDTNNKAIQIFSDEVTISNITITSGQTYIDSSKNVVTCSGVYLQCSNNSSITDCIFKNLRRVCVRSINSNNLFFKNNKLKNVYGSGFVIYNCENLLIEKNEVSNISAFGLWISTCSNVLIEGNFISKNKFGIVIDKGLEHKIINNSLNSNHQKGLMIENSKDINITENNFFKKLFSEDIGNIEEITNNFLFYKNAIFFNGSNLKWQRNYWSRPRILPKPIIGKTGKDYLIYCINFDMKPALRPN